MTQTGQSRGPDREAALREFMGAFKWARTGNLTWKADHDTRLTVFRRGDGWAYCIATDDRPTFSQHAWYAIEDALAALYDALQDRT
jgi:hypothetical protein